MSYLVAPETRFKRNCKALLGEIITHFEKLNDNGENINLSKLNLAYAYIKTEDREDLLVRFMANSYDHWEKFKEKEDEYFINNAGVLIPSSMKNKIKPYLEVLKNDEGKLAVSDKLRIKIWAHMHNMVKCCIHYYNDNEDDLPKEIKNIKNLLSAKELAKIWKLDLDKKVYEDKEYDSHEDSDNDSDSDDSDSD